MRFFMNLYMDAVSDSLKKSKQKNSLLLLSLHIKKIDYFFLKEGATHCSICFVFILFFNRYRVIDLSGMCCVFRYQAMYIDILRHGI